MEYIAYHCETIVDDVIVVIINLYDCLRLFSWRVLGLAVAACSPSGCYVWHTTMLSSWGHSLVRRNVIVTQGGSILWLDGWLGNVGWHLILLRWLWESDGLKALRVRVYNVALSRGLACT